MTSAHERAAEVLEREAADAVSMTVSELLNFQSTVQKRKAEMLALAAELRAAGSGEAVGRVTDIEMIEGYGVPCVQWLRMPGNGDMLFLAPPLRDADARPPLTEAMRAVLRNENDVYADEDSLYAALLAAMTPPIESQERAS